MNRIVEQIKGRVRVEVFGAFPESFLNASDILSTAVVEGSTKAYNQKLILADLVSV